MRVKEVVREIALWDQQGCLSPRVLFVVGDVREFSRRIAVEFESWERRWPARALVAAEAAAVHGFRARFAMGDGVEVGCLEPGTTAWTVAWDHDRDVGVGSPARVLRVTAVSGPDELADRLETIRDRVQGLGLAFTDAGPGWGWIPRIADLTTIQDPPAGWRADGRSGLAHLLAHPGASNAGAER